MNALLTVLALALCSCVALFVPTYGAPAVLICIVLATPVGAVIYRVETDRNFLLQLFISGLLVRMLIGTVIFVFELQDFFGGDANTYDTFGYGLLKSWQGDRYYHSLVSWFSVGGGWGMLYLVAAVYGLVGRNMLAVQFVNAVIGAATAPAIFLCAHHIFRNLRVARIAAFFVAFYPSLILWSSQGLKDAPIILLLVIAMLATLKLGEKLSIKYFVVLVCALSGILSLRFYIFYMVVVAIGGAFIIGMRRFTAHSLLRQFAIIIGIGLAMTYLGVLRTAGEQLDTFGNLKAVQRSRLDLARSARSGFASDVDVSTTSGAISAIPVGMIYLLFAPFPWQLANLRQSITLPEMLVWWGSFPLLVLGLWFTIKYRLRQALPIVLFTTMLTLAYSVFQGNVGTAYRQRAQLLVFYFIFVAVGIILLKERDEDQRQQARLAKQAVLVRRSTQNT
ncbi:MAG TPA: glycosyltransferase family 39 protein [Pyrinomonadaceae bacterium]|nr:glycosyltransferase family 39 protein [Pyrinomonadaceae bacterium]